LWSYIKFRFQRQKRRLRRDIIKARYALSDYSRVHLFGKWRQLGMIRGFVIAWWGLVVILGVGLLLQVGSLRGLNLQARPIAGGEYSEGLVGTVKNINPVLPEGSASADVNRLVFNGLTRFDARGELEADLAKNWTISPDGKTYTFHLRHGVKWHDGVPFTARDVEFTLAAIQSPDTRSPLSSSWQGVKAVATDDYTVVFTLPKPFTPFINATTVGILPRHLLEGVDPSSLRVADFNQKPIGTGPFKVAQYNPTDGEINLVANTDYYHGRPLLEKVTFKLYKDADSALDAYAKRQVMGVGKVPTDLLARAGGYGDLRLRELTVPDEVGLFFRTTSPVVSDKAVRTALAMATNRQDIIKSTLGGRAVPLYSPLLPGRPGAGAKQPNPDVSKARSMLDSAGWTVGKDGVRVKNGQKLEIKLVTQSGTQYGAVAEKLSDQWSKVGVRLQITEVEPSVLQQSYIRPRHYDALLYGIAVGEDPDVYAFWHSSQASDPGLNVSSYSSTASDKALEGGRTISDTQTRAAKYRAFLNAWMSDNPAVMLYSPYYVYGISNKVHGVSAHKASDPSDRFYGIEHWYVHVRKVAAG
jgi:peptide/nickel transport system substrate-binding protein